MRLWDKLAAASPDDPWVRESPTILCCDPVCNIAIREWINRDWSAPAGHDPERFPYCFPPFDLCFCEANVARLPMPLDAVRQVGAMTRIVDKELMARLHPTGQEAVRKCKAAGAAQVYISFFVVNIKERLSRAAQMATWGVNETAGLCDVLYRLPRSDMESIDRNERHMTIVASTLMFEAMLLSFTFANCCNVKLEDVTEDLQPSEKIRRRLKLPEVKRYTLNIAGHVSRPSREYNQGPQGVMPFHLCRGHFATYTPEKPLFGNPKLVGRYWHPPHMRGKKENGEIVKDYAIQG